MRYHVATGVYKKFSIASIAFVLALNSLAAATPLFLSQTASAAGTITVCDSGCDEATISDAVVAATPDDTITVSGTLTITSPVVISKKLTVQGTIGSTTINTSGTNFVFDVSAGGAGSTIKGFTLNKTDSVGEQRLINLVNTSDVNIWDNTFNGNWTYNQAQTVRGLWVSGSTNVDIRNNTFNNIRQPAYFADGSTGTVVNNPANNTRGWVVHAPTNPAANITFAGNTFTNNAVDIAFIKQPGQTCGVTDAQVVAISQANNNAVVKNPCGVTDTFSYVHVSASSAANIDETGGIVNPFNTIPAAISKAAAGGTVAITGGTYPLSGNTVITKPLTLTSVSANPILQVSGTGNVFTITAPNTTISKLTFKKTDKTGEQNIIGIQASDVTIDQNTFEGKYVLDDGEVTRALVTSNGANGTTISNNNVTGLRQPAYLNNGSSGTITNNLVAGTRGWVIEKASDFTLNGNSWNGNATDVAIIPGGDAGAVNNYTCERTALIRANNNNAYVDNQVASCPLDAPALLSPTNNSYVKGASLTNNWSSVVGATKYQYQSFSDVNASNLRWDETFTATSKTATNVADGTTFWWRVRAIDGGNTPGQWSPLWKVIVDNQKPSKPINKLPANGSTLSTNNFDFEWNPSTDASPLTYEFQSSQDPSRDISQILSGGNIWHSPSPLPTPMIHSSGAGDGAWFYQVRAIDAAGNYSDWSDIWSVILDTQGPTTPSITTSTPGQFFKASPVRANWTLATDTSGIKNYEIEYSFVRDGLPVTEFRTVAGNRLYRDQSLSGAVQGNFTIRVRAIDNFDNKGAWSDPITYTYDSIVPVITTNLVDNSALRGTVTVEEYVNDINPDIYKLRVYKEDNTTLVLVSNSATTNLDTTTLGGDGRYIAKFTATDKAGNTTGKNVWFNVDNTTPTINIGTTNGTVFGGSHLTVTGTGDVSEPYDSYAFSQPNVTGSPENWSWDVSALPSGNHTLSVLVSDAAGNTGASNTITITIDKDGPSVTITPVDESFIGGTVTPNVTASDANGPLSYSWAADDFGYEDIISNPNIAEPTFSPTSTGTYTFYLTVTDNLGNQTEEEFTFDWEPATVANETGNPPSFAVASASPTTPAGLIANQFNTNNPQVLGVATTSQPENNQDNGNVKAISTENKEKEVIESASSSFAWYWILLLIALVVAAYYAYRNWKLNKDHK